MGYVDKDLLPRETNVYHAHLHPIIFAGGTFLRGRRTTWHSSGSS
jgi:hypothetical protein